MRVTAPPLSGAIGPVALSSSGLGIGLLQQFYWQDRTQEPAMRQVSLNTASNLTHGLVFCGFTGGARWTDLVNGEIATRSGGITGNDQWFVTNATSAPLMYGYGKSSGTEYASYPTTPAMQSITTEHTWLVWCALSALSGFSALVGLPWANGSWSAPFTALEFLRDSSSSSASLGVTVAGPTKFNAVSDTGMIVADNVTRMLAATRNGDTVIFYSNGFQYGASKSLGTSGSAVFNTAEPLTIANRSSSSLGNSTGGLFFLSALWNRALSPSEIAQLYLRPLALLVPPFN